MSCRSFKYLFVNYYVGNKFYGLMKIGNANTDIMKNYCIIVDFNYSSIILIIVLWKIIAKNKNKKCIFKDTFFSVIIIVNK